MKKTVIAIIAVILMIQMLGTAIHAENVPEYSVDELKHTLRGAFHLYSVFFDAYYGLEWPAYDLVPERYPDRDPDFGRPYEYAKRTDEYSLWKDFLSELHTYYSSDASDLFLSRAETTEKDGFTYCNIVLGQAQSESRFIDLPEELIGAPYSVSLDESFKIVSADGSRIVASFEILYVFAGENKWNSDYTVEFTYEDGNWKVSGGTFVSTLIIDKAPATGSEVYGLLLASVISGAAVTYMTVKRKRRAA